MSDDATAGALSVPGRPSGAERHDEAVAGLEPGGYWRAAQDVPARSDRDGAVIVGRGRREGVAAGTVLLLKRLNHVDGFLHSVDLAAHPRLGGGERRFMRDEFLQLFIHEPEGAAIREAEIAATMEEMRRIEADMRAGPPDLPALPPAPKAAADVTSLVAHASAADAMHERLALVQANARARQDWVKLHTDRLGRTSAVVAGYYAEQAEAMQATIAETIEHAERMMAGVRSLKLYTGEDVSVQTLLEGDDARPDEPLHIYQRRLFMDEEVAMEAFETGVDYADMPRLGEILRRDPALVDRIAPQPRSIVLMRLRRHHTPIEAGIDMAGLFEEMEKAKLNQRSFLFVRNGGNVHLVHSDLLWSYEGKDDDFDKNGIRRLFPSRDDLDRPFRGVRGEDIRISDLEYVESRGRFDDRALAYKRLLILIWGLQDRTAIFGPFGGPSPDWMDIEWQAANFAFVRDDEMAIEERREDWRTFVRRQNRLLQPGSRVLCRFQPMILHEILPTLYTESDMRHHYAKGDRRWDSKPNCAWSAASRLGVVLAQRRGASVVVPVPVVDYDGRRKNVLADLALVDENADAGTYLVLDGLRPRDLDRLLQSRRDREEYLSFLGFLKGAKARLVEDEERHRPVVEAIEAACREGGIEGDVAEAAFEAIRLWRGANRGMDAPTRDADPKAFATLLDVTFLVLGRDVDLRGPAERVARDAGREPLRLVVTGSGEIALYATPLDDERVTAVGPHAWAARITLKRRRAGLVPFGRTTFEVVAASAAERVVERWEAEKAWLGLRAPKGVSYAAVRAALDEIAELTDEAVLGFHRGYGSDELGAAARRIQANSPNGQVERVEDLLPVGVAVMRDPDGGEAQPYVLLLEMDALVRRSMIDDVEREGAKGWCRRLYAKPTRHVAAIDRASSFPPLEVCAMRLSRWKAGTRHADGMRNWRRSVLSAPRLELDSFGGNAGSSPEAAVKVPSWREAIGRAGKTGTVKEDGKWRTVFPDWRDVATFVHPALEPAMDAVVGRWIAKATEDGTPVSGEPN